MVVTKDGGQVVLDEFRPVFQEANGQAASKEAAPKEIAVASKSRHNVRSGSMAERTEVCRSRRIFEDRETSEAKARKAEKRRAKLKQQRDSVLYWLDTKYDAVEEVVKAFNEAWQEASGLDDDMDLLWSDTCVSVDRFTKMQPYQKVNHFIGMTSITRKNNLGRNLLRMKKRFPEEYRFFPDTWILPTDMADFKAQFNGKKNKTFIVKPSDGYQGRGIFLTRDFESIPMDSAPSAPTMVVQRYIHKPFLLDGHKFDLRLYVLVTGCDPLRISLHEQGLVRLASEEYSEPKAKNLQNTMVHLTNYAINCDNPNFEENQNPEDGSDGHKRSLQAVLGQFEEEGMDVQSLMWQIEDLIVKTLLTVQPSLAHVYHSCQPDDVENAMCFEILGFDVMLDSKAKPWLIEVNHAPSFRCETELDRLVKSAVLHDAFELLNINPENRRRYLCEQQKGLEERQRGVVERRSQEERQHLEEQFAQLRDVWESNIKNGYRCLYPVSSERTQDFQRYLEAAIDIWDMMTGASRRKAKKDPEEESFSGTRRGASDEQMSRKSGEKRHGAAAAMISPASRTATASKRKSSSDGRFASGDSALTLASLDSKDQPELEAGPTSSKTSSVLGNIAPVPPEPPDPAPPQPLPRVPRHHDVAVGDTIHVQTNHGWEPVVVRRKLDAGHLDIEIQDGEVMAEVMPRIMKKAHENHGDTSSAKGPCLSAFAPLANGGERRQRGSQQSSDGYPCESSQIRKMRQALHQASSRGFCYKAKHDTGSCNLPTGPPHDTVVMLNEERSMKSRSRARPLLPRSFGVTYRPCVSMEAAAMEARGMPPPSRTRGPVIGLAVTEKTSHAPAMAAVSSQSLAAEWQAQHSGRAHSCKMF
jgi:tubulin polyglutamylase TTLL6/13